jgi:AcrR family transcriptional regulator
MTPEPTGRRARNRVARYDQLLRSASEIVTEVGLDGLTMQAVADRVDCAVGTIYTYFDSKSALIAALQISAIQTLIGTYHRSAEQWDEALEDTDEAIASLVRFIAFGRLFVAFPDINPREFELLQMLITSRERVLATTDSVAVVPHALTLLNEGKVLLDLAVSVGALTEDPDRPGTDSMSRTLRWAGGLDGALLVANAGDDPSLAGAAAVFHAPTLSQRLTEDLLSAWGAPPKTLAAAIAEIDRMDAQGALFPAVTTVDGIVNDGV